MSGSLHQQIESLWQRRDSLTPQSSVADRNLVQEVINGLDEGIYRASEWDQSCWKVNEWVKKAVLLSFRIQSNQILASGDCTCGYDKIPLKFANWSSEQMAKAGFRVVPGAIVRKGAYIAPNVILMPSFVNVGARVESGSLIDTWATVGSCAQVGKNCHISGGVGIGGVLEPLQASPVIIEDNCFIGARSEIAEGVRVERGAVLSMGVYLGASTKIVDRETGEIFMGRVPARSVVVPGNISSHQRVGSADEISPSLYCAVIVKKVDERTRSKTSINDLLRDE